jgi:hypothetical protein
MKPGALMYLADTQGQTAGPFAWTLVREWVCLSLVPMSAFAFLQGDNAWKTIADFPDLRQLPKSLCNEDRRPGCYLSADRVRLPSLSCQHSYAKALGCPFAVENIDRHLLSHITWTLSCQFPDRVDPIVAAEVEEASDWHNDPATDRQITCLRSIEVPIERGLTKGRACQLIGGEATEGQVRRLKFYKIRPPPYLTKEEASDLIDTYIEQHPETEEQYQASKLRSYQV